MDYADHSLNSPARPQINCPNDPSDNLAKG